MKWVKIKQNKKARRKLKKKMKGRPGENGTDGKQSKTLIKIIESSSRGCNEIDILPLCKEYMKICIEYGNRFENTKYVMNYILRTHKEAEETFYKVVATRNMEDLAQVILDKG